MITSTDKEIVLKETTCPQCERRFKTCKADESPKCFYCELQRYPNPEDPDYRDVAAARVYSGTYTKIQNEIYWEGATKGDPISQFPGFPEEFDIPRDEMKIEVTPLTPIPIACETTEELNKVFQEWFEGFLSVSEVAYNKEEDIIVLTVPDFVRSGNNPLLGLNLKYLQRFFASITEEMARKLDKKVTLGIHFPKYPQWSFKAWGY